MKITKRNGVVTVYDDSKLVNSMLKANGEVAEETLPPNLASRIADEVFSRRTEENEIITTQEIRERVYATLCEKGFPQTAKQYAEYKK